MTKQQKKLFHTDNMLGCRLTSLIKMNRSHRKEVKVTQVTDIYKWKAPVCTSDPLKHSLLLMWFTAVRLSPNSGCLGISDSCTHFVQCTSLYDRQTQSVCPSMPPTTHIRLYKSYINASSTHFWWWTSQLHLSMVHHTQSIHVFLRPTQTSVCEHSQGHFNISVF